MKYKCGKDVNLSDIIMVECGPDQKSLARVVAIGLDLAIDKIDKKFYSWAKSEKIINENTVVVEWIDTNPLAHDDPNYAPIGNYMTLDSVCCETFIKRGK
ncbi:MAG: hypothetical protein KJ915_10480 [Candidatus Omnitrophica bacterium]|nr:hypothetical protein [Candidatus Omnitrophota bacterium]